MQPTNRSSLRCWRANRIKQMRAREIAYRLGPSRQQLEPSAITSAQWITPLGLGSDCRGFGVRHYSAGFRLRAGVPPGPGPDAGPCTGHNPPQRCVHEGAAMVPGYGACSPVAVNFDRRCR